MHTGGVGGGWLECRLTSPFGNETSTKIITMHLPVLWLCWMGNVSDESLNSKLLQPSEIDCCVQIGFVHECSHIQIELLSIISIRDNEHSTNETTLTKKKEAEK